ELLSGISEHLAQLPVHVDETSVDADVADAERRELDRARIALLALAKPPHRLGLRIEVTDLDREPVNDLQETLVRLRDAARAEVEDADRPAARQDRKEECVFPAGALRDVLAQDAVLGRQIRDPQRLRRLPHETHEPR